MKNGGPGITNMAVDVGHRSPVCRAAPLGSRSGAVGQSSTQPVGLSSVEELCPVPYAGTWVREESSPSRLASSGTLWQQEVMASVHWTVPILPPSPSSVARLSPPTQKGLGWHTSSGVLTDV